MQKTYTNGLINAHLLRSADQEAARIMVEKEKERVRQEEQKEKERLRQEQERKDKLLSHSIAATAWSNWHMRLYFQNDEAGVHEATHDDGTWKFALSRNVLFRARQWSPLFAINWDSGQQVSGALLFSRLEV